MSTTDARSLILIPWAPFQSSSLLPIISLWAFHHLLIVLTFILLTKFYRPIFPAAPYIAQTRPSYPISPIVKFSSTIIRSRSSPSHILSLLCNSTSLRRTLPWNTCLVRLQKAEKIRSGWRVSDRCLGAVSVGDFHWEGLILFIPHAWMVCSTFPHVQA